MIRAFTAGTAIACLLASAGASAEDECVPEFFVASQTVQVANVRVGSNSVRNETFQIRIRNAGEPGSKCPASVRFARLSTSTLTDPSAYTIRSQGRQLDILPNESFPGSPASDLPIPQLPVGSNGMALPVQLVIPAGWGTKSGTLIDELLVSLVDEDGIVVDQLLLRIRLIIPPSVELRIVGATGDREVASVELGELEPTAVNLSDPFGLRIWSTSPYSVTFVSENGGRLVQNTRDGEIEYRLQMNGQRVNLSGGVATFAPDHTDSLGDFYPLRVTVPPFRSRAGDYSDRVEVTVTAN